MGQCLAVKADEGGGRCLWQTGDGLGMGQRQHRFGGGDQRVRSGRRHGKRCGGCLLQQGAFVVAVGAFGKGQRAHQGVAIGFQQGGIHQHHQVGRKTPQWRSKRLGGQAGFDE